MAGQARPRQEPQFQRQRTLVLGSLKTSLARALSAGVSRAAAAGMFTSSGRSSTGCTLILVCSYLRLE